MTGTTNPMSPRNDRIRQRIAESRRGLSVEGWHFAEGPHLLDEAIRAGRTVHEVFATADFLPRLDPDLSILEVSTATLAKLATTTTPQGVVALVESDAPPLAELLARPGLKLVLDGLQDPGNVGTILRSAEALGAAGILTIPGMARLFHQKVLRASAGAFWRVPNAELPLDRLLSGGPIWATVPHTGRPIWELDWRDAPLVVIGSEGAGVRAEILAVATPIRIPVAAGESLNAAVAASIVLYEHWRAGQG